MRRVGAPILAWVPEVSLAMLVHQGSYQTLSIAGIRISYFIFLACLLLLAAAYRKHVMASGMCCLWKGAYVTLLPLGLFAVFYLISSLWSPAPLFGAQRAMKAIFVAALAMLAGGLIAAQPQRLARLVYSVLAIGILFMVAGLISCTLRGWEDSLPSVFGVQAGIQGKSIGLAWVCAFGLLFGVRARDNRSLGTALALALLLAAITYGALACGSRGLLAALGAVGTGVVVYGLARAELRAYSAVAVAGIVLGAVVFFGTTPPNSMAMRLYHNLFVALRGGSACEVIAVARARSPLAPAEGNSPYADVLEQPDRAPSLREMFGGVRKQYPTKVYGKQGRGIEADLSLRERLGLGHAAIELFRQHWLAGVGAGGFAFWTDWRLAHNAILDVMADTGVVGLILLLAWLAQLLLLPRTLLHRRGGAAPPNGRRASGWSSWNILWLVLVFAIARAQFGTFFDEDRLLFLLGPILLLTRAPEQEA